MPYTIETNPVRLRICQQILNKSDKAHYDLINSLAHKDWDLLLLQEPDIDTYGNTKATSHWHTIYPSSHLSNNSTKRSVILVNANLDTNAWTQVLINNSNDVTAIQVCTVAGKVTVLNIYNDCTYSDTIHTIHSFLTSHRGMLTAQDTGHMIWCGDFNCHHPMWDEERNSHLFTTTEMTRAELLISLVADFGMSMALPPGTPTLQSLATGNWTRVDNVFVSGGLVNRVIICDMDPWQRGPSTDHVPVLTTVELEVPAREEEARRNFREMEWDDFREELAMQLDHILGPQRLRTD